MKEYSKLFGKDVIVAHRQDTHASLEGLNAFCKALVSEGKEHPAQIILRPEAVV